MTYINQLSNDLTKLIATELKNELKLALPPKIYKNLINSIKIIKIKNTYNIKMDTSWKTVEYSEVPFIRYTFNTKIKDILKKVTKKLSI